MCRSTYSGCEGFFKAALDLLTQRFGPLSPALTKRIQSMGEADLAKLRTRLFDARSLEELLP